MIGRTYAQCTVYTIDLGQPLRHIHQAGPNCRRCVVSAHGHIGYVPPEPHLQRPADFALLFQVGFIQPRRAQRLDLRTVRPSEPGFRAIGRQREVIGGIERGNSVKEGEEYAPTTLVRRFLARTAGDHRAVIHGLGVDVEPRLRQLVDPHLRHRMTCRSIGRYQHDNLFASIAGGRQVSLDRRVVPRPGQHVNPGIIGERHFVHEQADLVLPSTGVGAGHGCHRFGLIDRCDNKTADCRIVERRLQVVQAHETRVRGFRLHQPNCPITGQ